MMYLKNKDVISRQDFLRCPDYKLPFYVYTNACDYQLGGVIMQNENPVVFYSRKLNSTKRTYTTMKKKLLSTVETAVCYRNILFGFKIHSHSDHKSLSFESFKSEQVHRL